MTREEFIKVCQSAKYASKKVANEYADKSGKDEFDEDDFVEVFRLAEHYSALKNHLTDAGMRDLPNGGKTTKRYTVYNSHEG